MNNGTLHPFPLTLSGLSAFYKIHRRIYQYHESVQSAYISAALPSKRFIVQELTSARQKEILRLEKLKPEMKTLIAAAFILGVLAAVQAVAVS